MLPSSVGEVLALIPARGGSKSIPRKNVVHVMGKPLIAHTIEAAKKSRRVSRIVVTTEDSEIAEIAKSYGAEVPFLRPVELAGDDSLDIEFHLHAIQWLAKHENYHADMIVNLRPTTPTRRWETIDRAIETFHAHPEADSLRSVQLASETPFKMWFVNEQGFMSPVFISAIGIREPFNYPRQKLPLVYWQNGYIDITKEGTLLKKNSTTGDLVLPFIVQEDTIDIDYEDEIEKVENKMKGGSANSIRPAPKPSGVEKVRFPS